jgi:N-glycosylase/DNA lyase
VPDATATFTLSLPPKEPLGLAHAFRCGQIFRWRPFGDTWVGSLRGTALALRADPGSVNVTTAGEPITEAEITRFLGLDDRLAEIMPQIDTDPVIRSCLQALPGMRILRQDPWECLITYICSAWNNIPKIDRSVGLIAERWGRRHALEVEGERVEVATFPSPEALASASVEDLRVCGLGYRAPYVAQTARLIAAGGLDLEALRTVEYPQALTALLRLPGIGRKVADCILLFALDKSEAVPVDVWVRRVLQEYYGSEIGVVEAARGDGSLGNREYDAIQQFAWQRWGRWAGYAQQYLFYGKRLGII